MRDGRDKNIKKEKPSKPSNIKQLPDDLKKALDRIEKEEKKKR